MAMILVILGNSMGNRMVQDKFQHSSDIVHRHVATVVTFLATVMAPDIIQPADHTFWDMPEHIQHSDQYWPHFKVLCEFGSLTWFYLNYFYGHTMYFISHGIFVAMVKVALVRLKGFTSPWSYQLMSSSRNMAGRGPSQQITCAHVTLTWSSHSHVLDGKGQRMTRGSF